MESICPVDEKIISISRKLEPRESICSICLSAGKCKVKDKADPALEIFHEIEKLRNMLLAFETKNRKLFNMKNTLLRTIDNISKDTIDEIKNKDHNN